MNTTFFTATFALTMLCLDPLWRAVYVLRCFYGESLRTGRDLAVQLARVRGPANTVLLLAFAGWCALAGMSAPIRGAEPTPIAAPVDASELDRRIADVLERREYSWRMPREKAAHEKGWFDQWIEDVGKKLRAWGKALSKNLDRFFRWIIDHFFKNSSDADGASRSWGSGARLSLWAALAVSLAVIVWALVRALRDKRATVVAAEALPAMPDLTADDVAADELPEDGWLQLAREHAARGDFALALRAMWLACLAHLGHRELLRIARHKSNRDYDLELRRRARTRDELLSAFRENLIAFESAWYGQHEVTPDIFARFSGNLERIRVC